MKVEDWSRVDDYINGLFVRPDPALDAALKDSLAAGLPPISVTPSQGKLLYLLARLQGSRQILEIGTLGGYSTIWLGRALPSGGSLISLEAEQKHARVARGNIERAGLSGLVEVRVGRAQDILPVLVNEGRRFDFVFIDADKPGYADYFEWSLKLCRVGGLIVADNVVREGEVVDGSSGDADVQGVRRFNELVAGEGRVSATAVQTVGSKGWDGFAVVLVTGG